MFTTLDLADPAARAPDPPPSPAAAAEPPPSPATPAASWRFDALPAGFELALHQRIDRPDGAVIEHFLFTDRLAAYSVYIEPDPADGLVGGARIGAIHAAGRRRDGHQITAVGEVPAATVAAAIAGARPPPAPP